MDTWNFIDPDDYYELDDHLHYKGHQKIAERIMQLIMKEEILKDSKEYKTK